MFEQLKAIMKNGERYIVVESGRPEYVMMSFADYVALIASGGSGEEAKSAEKSADGGDLIKANAELEEIRTYTEGLEAHLAAMPRVPPERDPATIRLEDLPL